MYVCNSHVYRKVLEFSVDKGMVNVVHSTSHFSGITSNLTSVQNVHFWELHKMLEPNICQMKSFVA